MTGFPSLVRSTSPSGQVRYRLGDRVVDRHLEFVAGRARPNTLRAVAFDLKTFFTAIVKGRPTSSRRTCSSSSPRSVATGRWCGWLTASRGVGADDRRAAVVGVGVLFVRDRPRRHRRAVQIRCRVGWRPDATATAAVRGCRWCGCLARCPRSSRRPTRTGLSLRCAPTATGPWCWRCCWPGCAAARCSGCGSPTCRLPTGGW
jgi:hypothetical protein